MILFTLYLRIFNINSSSKAYLTFFQINIITITYHFITNSIFYSATRLAENLPIRLRSSQIHLPSNDYILLVFPWQHTHAHTYTPTHGPDQQRYLVHDTPAILPLWANYKENRGREPPPHHLNTLLLVLPYFLMHMR